MIGKEHMSITTSPFGRHTEAGIYLDANGKESSEVFEMGTSYLIHKTAFASAAAEASEGHEAVEGKEPTHAAEGEEHEGPSYAAAGDYPDAIVDQRGYVHRKYIVSSGVDTGLIKSEPFGPKAFGALFFFITGFHGFHVFPVLSF